MTYPALDVQPINPVNAFLQGQQGAAEIQAARTRNALLSTQLTQAQRANALYGNPNATAEDFIRNGDVAAGQALQQTAVQAQTSKQQAVQQIGSIAQRALSLDPVSRKVFVKQAMSAYGPAFQALGVDPAQGIATIDTHPDSELDAQLQELAKFAPQQAPISVAPGTTLIDPNTRQPVYSSAGKVEYKDTGDQLIPTDSATGQVRKDLPPIKKNLTPDQARGTFTGGAQELLASLAAKGVTLPAGLRSKAQMASTLNGLIEKFPDLSPDDIADRVAKGQIDFGVARKETTTAAGQAGRVAIATNELNTFAPVVLAASAKVPRGSFIPINRLLQAANQSISDPNLLQLKISINSMLNAYDQLAARGGTDVNKRAEAHALLESAQSPEALAAGIRQFQVEAAAAGKAASAAEQYRPPGSAETPASSGPVKVNTPQEAMALPSGTQFMTPDGRVKVRP